MRGNTYLVLGRIVIDGDSLTAEVNSARRAKTIRGKIEAKLGAGARFRMEEIGNLDKMMGDEYVLPQTELEYRELA
jgi:hypothetical protein